ncbi:MAG: HAD-IIIC family phosphatase [bacterium]
MQVDRYGQSKRHEAFMAKAGISPLPCGGVKCPDGRVPAILTLQFFGEHCTECAAPDCHGACDLFERGPSGFCRRFLDGIVVRRVTDPVVPYCLDIVFKPWGRLLAVGNVYGLPFARYRRWASAAFVTGWCLSRIQSLLHFLPARWQWRISDKLRGMANRVPRFLNKLAAGNGAGAPNDLLYVIGNPHCETLDVELSLSGFADSQQGRSFRKTIRLIPGWNTGLIDGDEIRVAVDLTGLFRLCVVPLLEQARLLHIHYIGFIAQQGTTSLPNESRPGPPLSAPSGRKKVKLVVFDLDNTLWDGILVEAQDGKVALKSGIREILDTLDQRGILLSVASRNTEDVAKRKLEEFGLLDYFLSPQINWGRKSESIRRIIQEVNVGEDTVAFVDDSEFERAEVTQALSDVRGYDARYLAELPEHEEFIVPVTDESRSRRMLYRTENRRKAVLAASRVDYDTFLENCKIVLRLMPLNQGNQERVYELVQRTNQLNYSGTRYTREALAQQVSHPGVVPVVMDGEDTFGAYGIVGFALLRVESDSVVVADMMFSCRIQGKKIENSFLAHIVRAAATAGLADCICLYNRTQRNASAGALFPAMGFALKSDDRPSPVERHEIGVHTPLPGRLPVAVSDEIDISRQLQCIKESLASVTEGADQEARGVP